MIVVMLGGGETGYDWWCWTEIVEEVLENCYKRQRGWWWRGRGKGVTKK